MRFSVRSNLMAHGRRKHGRALTPIVWPARGNQKKVFFFLFFDSNFY